MLYDNRVIIACAGAGKTTRLIEQSINNTDRKILFITYTNNNLKEIINGFEFRNSGIPSHVDIMTWYQFLLRECVRPYQNFIYPDCRIDSIKFVNKQSRMYVSESNTKKHFMHDDKYIYSDKISKFICRCDEKSSNSITKRLEKIYSEIYIDEFQDLSGWDIDVVKKLFKSKINVTIVGDPRQHIYSTNPSQKNKQYLGIGLLKLLEHWQYENLCFIEYMNYTHRCKQDICQFANKLWPDVDPIHSLDQFCINHQGVFLVYEKDVPEYINLFNPQILRHDKRSKSYGYKTLNFGESKGLQFYRVLIVPTKPIMEFLKTGELSYINKSRYKFHVAVTRAKNSLAFILDVPSPIVSNRWTPDSPL